MYDNIKDSSFLPTQSVGRTHASYGTGISLERVAGVPTTPADFEKTKAILKKRGMVAHHDTDRTFCIIHLSSGDHDGQHPERRITITQDNYMLFINDLKDTMAQAAVWYKTNVVDSLS